MAAFEIESTTSIYSGVVTHERRHDRQGTGQAGSQGAQGQGRAEAGGHGHGQEGRVEKRQKEQS